MCYNSDQGPVNRGADTDRPRKVLWIRKVLVLRIDKQPTDRQPAEMRQNEMRFGTAGPSSRGAGARGLKLGRVSRVQPLGEQAADSLRTALRRGALLPGQRLTTRDVAATLDISLTPAREALNRLTAERVLELTPDRVAMVPVLTQARYTELCAIRLSLEGMAAHAACRRLTAEDVAHLEKLYAVHETAYAARDAKTSLRHNEDFHFTIYAGAGMPALLQIVETLWLQVGPSMNFLFTASYDESWTGGRNHRAMLDAIRAGDAAALSRAVRRDLLDGRKRLTAVLPE
ncbi:DNA-binding transcriptional regulator, GntR family [Rhizobiales bacterium GAS191]|jgi:DNA-binding GntR family transcriptional regulator|nr:DNA-binding transcriptional regulator, GntR family [Rhizobiales bacterium GAS113]SEB97488.1 DNA-binding transcriptional regulator, GntR family [Rhizobiales bacterium GAS188]SED25503.1 DNA-binding transcriptional regulator, GntR family [Rhizobiales bacterium GAS191]